MQSDAAAVLIGITDYRDPKFGPLPGAAYDVRALEVALQTHRDGALNFDVRTHIVDYNQPWGAGDLLDAIDQGIANCDHFLFYYSGHGDTNQYGLQLITPEKEHPFDSGVYFDTLLHRFNRAKDTEVTVILDCCYSGAAGDSSASDALMFTHLRDGVTILASSGRNDESEGYEDAPSVFTQEVVNALYDEEYPSMNVVELYSWTRRVLHSQQPVLRTFGSRYSALRAASRELGLTL